MVHLTLSNTHQPTPDFAGGTELYVTAIMCISTRFILALNTTPTKKGYDAVPLLQKVRNMAGRVPRLFITDGTHQYHVAFKKVFLTLKDLRCIHIRDIHIRNFICNTNKQERLNGELAGHYTVRPRHKQRRVADIPHGDYTPQLH